VHFAAESHVDRSIQESESFLETNIKGTHVLLNEAKKNKIIRFIHISTDEVYGDIKKGKFSERSPLNPSSPYSASKAAADCLVKSYIRTYNFPAIIIRPCNNYGPWQYPEKYIPVAIYSALNNKKIPIYAKGLNRREWLYVSDCVEAIFIILKRGKDGQIYNISSGWEEKNIILAYRILRFLNRPKKSIQFVKDRPGHDYRYALDFSKIAKLGWKPKATIAKGINKTVNWYKQNHNWLEKRLTNEFYKVAL
jgi:dTDP-glucose 4,6-dehydratase